MGTWMNIDHIKILPILAAEDKELTELVNQALMDAVTDTLDRYKDEKKTRQVQINLDITRMDDQVKIDWKVIPKLAPYERRPAKEKPTVPEGQQQLALDTPEADPLTGEVIDADFEEIQEDTER